MSSRTSSSKRVQRLANTKVKPPPQKHESEVPADRVALYLRSRFNPIRRLTPELLAVYLDRSKIGFLREIALVWDSIEDRDDKIKLAMGLRKKSVARFDYQVELLPDLEDKDKAQAALHKQALEYFYGNLTCTRAIDENEVGGVKLLVRQMMDAVGAKYSVHEIVWQPQPDGNLTAQFRWTPLWFFENLTGRLRYLTREGETYGIDLEEGGWMITTGEGLMYAMCIAYMFKTLPLRDWITFSEVFGQPARIGKTPSQPGSAQWDALAQAVQDLGTDFAAVMNTTDSIELLEAKVGAAALPFEALVERMDRAIVALARGGDLSTMSSGKGSQGHGSQRQDEEADAILDDDVEMINETLHQRVSKYVIEYQLGDDRCLARFKLIVPPDNATAQDLAIYQFLVSSAPDGQGLAWDEACRRFGVVPANVGPNGQVIEPVLKAPQQDEQIPNNLGNSRLVNSRASRRAKSDPVYQKALFSLSATQAVLLRPLVSDLKAASEGDEDGLRDRVANVAAKIPALLKDINVDPATAQIIANGLVADFFNGHLAKPGSPS
jgi:phage gp29-like protein